MTFWIAKSVRKLHVKGPSGASEEYELTEDQVKQLLGSKLGTLTLPNGGTIDFQVKVSTP